MQTEIEAKFLNVDHNEIRERLRAIGAVCELPNRVMRRKTFDFPDGRLRKECNGWARLRDEGDKITMSYKQLDDRSFQGTKEVNILIDSFDKGCALLESLGLQVIAYQETKRESWKLGTTEIELDEWPWAKPYLEIEGPSEAAVKEVALQLGLDWSKVLHGSVEVVYMAEYDVTEDEINAWPQILFGDVPADIEKRRKK